MGHCHSLFHIDNDRPMTKTTLTLRQCRLEHLIDVEDKRQIGAAIFAMGQVSMYNRLSGLQIWFLPAGQSALILGLVYFRPPLLSTAATLSPLPGSLCGSSTVPK